ncbi:glycosyltransferase family 1 protein [Pseudoalteromonas sp.]|uniref:glycosyltransferase family 4 protein n=1 Tax=Pseudoalteromonas sp. TaxID=53249 RepID=UPI0026045905|nr:glycosyltransferase family 1 protein [Pseudoalteromonas sp.]MCP4588746.1 glycosyltransferase family 4 protein [Pseudoalteromonas sp.]
MQIVTNVAPLLSPLTGIGHYTEQLLRCLLQAPQIDDLCGVSPLAFYSQAQLEKLLSQSIEDGRESNASPSEKKAVLPWRKVAKRVPYARHVKRLIQSHTAKRQASRFKDHIYWEPNYSLLPLGNPSITTVHDLSHIHYPQYHPAERVRLLEHSLAESIEHSARVIAVSEYTKQDISHYFGINASKIDVVSPAVSDSFRSVYSESDLQLVRKLHGLPERFILSVATIEPRKNIQGLLQAYSQLPPELRTHVPLVLVGLKGWLTEEVEKLLRPMVESGQVIRLGYVDQEHLPMIYQAATCLAYVSFFEGYGMPIAEAMAAGVPVLTSSRSSMPEVAAGSALLVNPEDIDAISQGLRQIVEDSELCHRMSEQGKVASSMYTWQASTEKLIAAFHKVHSGVIR